MGVLLAGGQSSRMGCTDKCLLQLNNKSILHKVIERAAPQVQALLLSANGDANRFSEFDLEVIQDIEAGFLGPLIGILSAMYRIRSAYPECHWLMSFATDTPFFPLNLVSRLHTKAQTENASIICAESAGRIHPVFTLWSLELADDLLNYLKDNKRSVFGFLDQHKARTVEFSCSAYDPFFNINTPADLEIAKKLSTL